MAELQGRAALTEAQTRVLEHIKATAAWKGVPPTMREIAYHLGCQVNAVQGHVKRLVELGYLQRDGKGKSRSLRVVGGKPDEVETLRERVRVLEEANKRLMEAGALRRAVEAVTDTEGVS